MINLKIKTKVKNSMIFNIIFINLKQKQALLKLRAQKIKPTKSKVIKKMTVKRNNLKIKMIKALLVII